MLPRRALSLKQPYAHFIVDGSQPSPKRIENRPRRILNWTEWEPVGEFWIHASAGEGEAYWTQAINSVRAAMGSDYPVPHYPAVPRGGIIGRATIVGMVTPKGEVQLCGKPRLDRPLDERWHIPGQHGYVLANVRAVPFVKCPGMLGFWRVPEDVLAALAAGGIAA
jgi:hypothetical protein